MSDVVTVPGRIQRPVRSQRLQRHIQVRLAQPRCLWVTSTLDALRRVLRVVLFTTNRSSVCMFSTSMLRTSSVYCAQRVAVPVSCVLCPVAAVWGGVCCSGRYCTGNPLSTSTSILVSTLQFSCVKCLSGLYSLAAGASSGAAGTSNNVSCLPCPRGGTCVDGGITAANGYWGASDPSSGIVAFVVCPDGYCCFGDCDAIDGCAVNRHGRLCGACVPGTALAVGSSDCVPVGRCDGDRVVFAVVATVITVVSAVLQLAVVSDVWRPSTMFPSGKVKLALYFFQVGTWYRATLGLGQKMFKCLLWVVAVPHGLCTGWTLWKWDYGDVSPQPGLRPSCFLFAFFLLLFACVPLPVCVSLSQSQSLCSPSLVVDVLLVVVVLLVGHRCCHMSESRKWVPPVASSPS